MEPGQKIDAIQAVGSCFVQVEIDDELAARCGASTQFRPNGGQGAVPGSVQVAGKGRSGFGRGINHEWRVRAGSGRLILGVINQRSIPVHGDT